MVAVLVLVFQSLLSALQAEEKYGIKFYLLGQHVVNVLQSTTLVLQRAVAICLPCSRSSTTAISAICTVRIAVE